MLLINYHDHDSSYIHYEPVYCITH